MRRFLVLPLLLCPAIAGADTITTLPSDDLDWAVTPEGVRFAPLIGDRFEEAYMAMVELFDHSYVSSFLELLRRIKYPQVLLSSLTTLKSTPGQKLLWSCSRR